MSPNIFVLPHELCHGPEVDALHHEVGGEGVAQIVEADMLRDPGSVQSTVKALLDVGKGLAFVVEDKGAHVPAADSARSAGVV